MKKDIVALVADLKRNLQDNNKLSEVADAFYDLAAMEAFLGDGEPGQNEIFTGFLKKGIENWSGNPIESLESNCVTMPHYNLYHGPAFVGESAINLFVFDDIQLGLMILFDGEKEKTIFMRIAANQLEDGSFLVDFNGEATD